MKKYFVGTLLLALGASSVVFAAVGTQTDTRTITLYKSGSPIGTYASVSACTTAKEADKVLTGATKVSGSITYECRDSLKSVVKFVPASSSSSSSSSSTSSSSSSASSSTPSGWTHCANYGQRCPAVGLKTIRFGVDVRWDVRNFIDGTQCDTINFTDPAPGATKTCQIQSGSSSSSSSSSSTSSASSSSSSSSSSSAATDSVQLTWTAPTLNTDGSALTDLTGYKLYYGTSPSALTSATPIGLVATYTVPGLATGQTWFFALSSISASSGEGSKTNAASKAL